MGLARTLLFGDTLEFSLELIFELPHRRDEALPRWSPLDTPSAAGDRSKVVTPDLTGNAARGPRAVGKLGKGAQVFDHLLTTDKKRDAAHGRSLGEVEVKFDRCPCPIGHAKYGKPHAAILARLYPCGAVSIFDRELVAPVAQIGRELDAEELDET